MRNIVLLGSTGSIGTQTLDVVRNNSSELKVIGLAANRKVEEVEEQVREFKPKYACMFDENAAKDLADRIKDTDTKVYSGMDGLLEIVAVPEADTVLTAVVGMIGIRPTIRAIESGKDIALANKETLVCAGHIIMPLAKEKNVKILPVDSEHSAIFQSLNGEPKDKVEKILLTASGGPFRGKKKEELKDMTAADALKHPNWDMGPKVTIDSSTLVNKGLEVMEARWLFDVSLDNIQVLIHPQSIVHSAVQYCDGAVIAQLGVPDMKLPIQYALFYPDRRPMSEKRLDLFELYSLTFEKPDTDTFRGLKLAFDSAYAGGSMPTVFNAANEMAVKRFLKGDIKYLEIYDMIQEAMEHHNKIDNPTVSQILEAEKDIYEFLGNKYNI
ncbi:MULTISPECIES: 1-deoxy-D-xylulose-5-phosphate reductoisomerase [unclassified Butyrivibrio]|uniref:1-deoxy-D-xylulose-5-phosphate reductoisomerase n=1 Tax=unclassified Butyrivibrio TaxID=2639466 RepID=UPI0008E2A968|nr:MULTISPECIES: 1-deoxy-D-xylulose-5-phosphate reductoisomerase [unclassified Butyrivibrio]RKM62870.1 1-deoxy-D-xylulose-5-phosphate reductoisomerase [Butyrivibrio sp. XB500-5]SFU90949.1 1-deoxy-D-xylulose 5-phosphate reductoisomerase [Butyrivibrio sp. INlla21]